MVLPRGYLYQLILMGDTPRSCEKMGPDDGSIPEWALALLPVRKLFSKNGTKIKHCVYDALAKGAPQWARKILESSVSKGFYKANACGPTKRAVLSVLDKELCERVCQQAPKMKKKYNISVPEISTKLCRIVLRQTASIVEDFCRLLEKNIMDSPVNEGQRIHESPEMVFRALDFRTIDCKLAVGAYRGSLEAFLLDMQEVLGLVIKLKEYLESDYVSADAEKEVGKILKMTNQIPQAIWNSGHCKLCSTNKDDDHVLLCDICDGEYHTYCLKPSLKTVPQGKWYCPSCISPAHVARGAMYFTQLPRPRQGEKSLNEDQSEKLGLLGASGEGEGSKPSGDKNLICEVCGDRGYSCAIVSCSNCEDAHVHRYCFFDKSQILEYDGLWSCEDCVPFKPNPPKSVEAASGRTKQKGTQKEITSPPDAFAGKSKQGEGSRSEKKKGKMKMTKVRNECAAKKGGSRVSVQPIADPIWKGSLRVGEAKIEGVELYLSNKASPNTTQKLSSLPTLLVADLLPKTAVWPLKFYKSPPADADLALYFFPHQGTDGKAFDSLVGDMTVNELALRARLAENGQLSIFTSVQLPLHLWKFQGKRYYLWGFVKANKSIKLKKERNKIQTAEQ